MARTFFLIASLLICSAASFAAPLRLGNDIDGDGMAEMVVITIAADGTLSWRAFSGADDSLMKQQDAFGRLGDHIALANWIVRGRSNFAYVTLSGGTIYWNVLQDSNEVVRKAFGSAGDTVVSGADVNGNGLTDAVIVRKTKKGDFLWYTQTDFFSPTRRSKAIRTRFGREGDLPFFASYNGRQDWFGILRRTGDGYRIYFKQPLTKKLRHADLGSISGAVTPVVLRERTGGDLLAFSTIVNSVTELKFFNLKGREILKIGFALNGGELLAGNFLADYGSEIVIKNAVEYTIFNPITQSSTKRSWADGIAIDDLNINRLSESSPPPAATPSPPPSATPGETPLPTAVPTSSVPIEDNPPPPAGPLSQVCTSMHVMDTNVLYKPGSGGTADGRTGKPAFLWFLPQDNPHVWKLYVLSGSGQQIAIFGFYNVGYPYSRFYSGFAPGTGETAAELAQKAAASAGSTEIYFYTKSGNCWGPIPNPRNRCGGTKGDLPCR